MISKLKKVLKNPHKKELLKGSAETIFIKIAGMFLGYAFIIYLSRNYGAEAVGIYQISLQFITMAAIVSLLGFNQSIVRFSSELVSIKQLGELKKVIKKFSIIALSISSGFAVVVYMLSEIIAEQLLKDKSLAIIFKSLAIILPFLTLNLLYVELLRGLKKIKTSEFLRLFSVRFMNILFFLMALWLVEFNNFIPVLTYEVSLVFSFLLASYLAYKYIKLNKLPDNSDVPEVERKYIFVSFTMYQSILLMMLSSQSLVFVLAYYTEPAEVGIYNVAFQIAALSTFVFAAISNISAPKYSELYHGNKEEFNKTVHFSSKLAFWSSGVISIMTIIFSSWLMGLFGEEFEEGTTILIILSVAFFVNAFTGPCGVLFDMIGKHYIRRNILFFNTVLTLICAFILIPEMGGVGLAYTILINMLVGNFVGVYYVHKQLGVNMIYLPLITKG